MGATLAVAEYIGHTKLVEKEKVKNEKVVAAGILGAISALPGAAFNMATDTLVFGVRYWLKRGARAAAGAAAGAMKQLKWKKTAAAVTAFATTVGIALGPALSA